MIRPRSRRKRGAVEPQRPPGRWLIACFALLPAALSYIAFRQGLDGQFLNWDDDRNFLENEFFRGIGLVELRWAWETYHLGVWQPLSWLLLGAQHELGGLAPKIYHGFSLGLHALNSVVLYLLTLLLLRTAKGAAPDKSPTGDMICAAAAAGLFAVHPLRVEPVAWISAQPYLPSALFYMTGIAAYVWGYRGDRSKNARRFWLGIAFVCYLSAVGSKAVAVTLPAIALILDIYPLRRWGGRAGWSGGKLIRIAIEKLPFFAVAVFVSLWAAEAKDFNASRAPFREFEPDARLAQSAYGLVFYLAKTVAPVDLVAYYRLPDSVGLLRWPYGLAAATVIAATVALILLRRRCPSALAAWAAYVVILLPNLGIVQISRQIAADRYSYVAIMPIVILFAGGLRALSRRRRFDSALGRSALAVAFAAVATASIVATNRQVAMWGDSVSLWERNLAVDPNCAVAWCQLGQALAVAGRFDEAVEHLDEAVRLETTFAFAYANLGAIHLAADRPQAAQSAFGSALKDREFQGADRAKAHAGLGAALARMGSYEAAWRQTREAQRLGFPKDKIKEMVRRLQAVSSEPAP